MRPATRRTAPGVAKLLATIAMLDVSLRVLGFSRTTAMVKKLVARAEEQDADLQLIMASCQRVAVAAAFYPGRARCLEQSLALYLILRRRGIAVDLRLGVQPYPFNAHAWVEYHGTPLNERAESIRQFVPVQDFAV